MRTIIFFLFLLFVGCAHQPAMVLQSDYLKLQDSIQGLQQENQRSLRSIGILRDSVVIMQDSIEDLLVRPMMTSEQFLELYRYYSLKKYYLICKKNPTQWKFYKGWSSQVFEQ